VDFGPSGSLQQHLSAEHNFSITKLVVKPTSIMLNAQGSGLIGSYHAPHGLRKVS